MVTIEVNDYTVVVSHITCLCKVKERQGAVPPAWEMKIDLINGGYIVAHGTSEEVTAKRAEIVAAIEALPD